jgi:hypothetical protein
MNWRTALMYTVLFPVAGHLYMHTFCSRQPVFERINLGEPETEVKKRLKSAQISCFEKGAPSKPGRYNYSVCYFDDAWRTYQVAFSPFTHTVAAKDFTYNQAPHTAIQEIGSRVQECCYQSR